REDLDDRARRREVRRPLDERRAGGRVQGGEPEEAGPGDTRETTAHDDAVADRQQAARFSVRARRMPPGGARIAGPECRDGRTVLTADVVEVAAHVDVSVSEREPLH